MTVRESYGIQLKSLRMSYAENWIYWNYWSYLHEISATIAQRMPAIDPV